MILSKKYQPTSNYIMRFIYVNEIEPQDEKLCAFVFTGVEAIEQPFVYHFAPDEDGCLILGDGSDW